MSSTTFHQAYPHLFSPITIRGTVIRNRIISAPQGAVPNLMVRDVNGYDHFTEEAAYYYGRIARGGAGIVYTGECAVDPRYRVSTNQFDFYNDSTLTNLHLVSDAIHAFGAKAGIELNHSGKVATSDAYEPIGPIETTVRNAAHVDQMSREYKEEHIAHVRAMTKEDMDRVADCFANAAVMAKRGGFDVIMIHAGHGWLLHQFLSPRENKRQDEYGGSVENRVRFPIEVLKRVREAVGKEIVLELRYSANEFVEDGATMEDVIKAAVRMQEYIDILQCSVGVRTGMHSLVITHPTFFVKQACNDYLAAEIKKHVKIPVDTIGGIDDPALCEELLANGAADFVAMARGHIADPDWGNKARSGHPEDIRPCLRCLRCLYRKPTGESRCSVNPTSTWDHLLQKLVPPSAGGKKVVVIGGGPAGMQAAVHAAERGHEVVLFEASGSLGGQLKHAETVDFKRQLWQYRNYLKTQVLKAGVTVRLNTEATPELVACETPDAVIVAVGAKAVVPPVPGADRKNVFQALEAFGQEEKIGDRVVIIGGGSVGCEAAVHFTHLGRHVSLVELTDTLMAEEKDPHMVYHTLHFLDHAYDYETAGRDRAPELSEDCKVKRYLSCRCTEITEEGVRVTDAEGKRLLIQADSVIFATGMRARAEERDRFTGIAYDVIPVGDCLKASNVQNASFTGYNASFQF